MRRALAIDEKSFGPEHSNVARDLDNLAQLLQDTNRLAEAESLYRRALAIDEKNFGPEHPNVARALTNLAWLRAERDDWVEAAALGGRAKPDEALPANWAPFVLVGEGERLGAFSRKCAIVTGRPPRRERGCRGPS